MPIQAKVGGDITPFLIACLFSSLRTLEVANFGVSHY